MFVFRAFGFAAIGNTVFGFACVLLGLVIFSYNKLCDPVSAGTIFSKDLVRLIE